MIGDRWGVTGAETALRFDCDDFVDRPVLAAWRGVSVHAPVAAVWPWVTQIRAAPYSYDWIDNRGRRSPARLLGLDPPETGDRFTAVAGRPAGTIVAVRDGRQLTGLIMGAYMSYRLIPAGPDQTRLLLKVVMQSGRAAAPLVCAGDLVMARRQLLNFKALAERDSSAPIP